MKKREVIRGEKKIIDTLEISVSIFIHQICSCKLLDLILNSKNSRGFCKKFIILHNFKSHYNPRFIVMAISLKWPHLINVNTRDIQYTWSTLSIQYVLSKSTRKTREKKIYGDFFIEQFYFGLSQTRLNKTSEIYTGESPSLFFLEHHFLVDKITKI